MNLELYSLNLQLEKTQRIKFFLHKMPIRTKKRDWDASEISIWESV